MPLASNCPECGHALRAESWLNERQAHCRSCDKDLEFVPFPALSAVRPVARSAAANVGNDAVCFFHATNRAESVCTSCGRLLCSVCAIDFAGQCLCPSCIADRRTVRPEAVPSRMLWDSLALLLATLPLVIWPCTLLTAPTAVGLALYGWNKPCSLVRGSKIRLMLALLLGAAQIVGWGIAFFMMIRSSHMGPRH